MNEIITCIGAGYVGGPTMAVIAEKCKSYQVNVVDISQDRIDKWNSNDLPIYEPGLKELVQKNRNKNLFFTTDIQGCIEKSDIIFIAVNTPTKIYGHGKNYSSNLEYLYNAVKMIAKYSKKGKKIIVEKSTVPIKTCEIIKQVLSRNKECEFEIVSNPEFLAEGTAIQDLLNPSRVLIGGNDDEYHEGVQQIANIYKHWVDPEKIITTNIFSSELAKLVANAMLAQRISSINSISALCEKTGANINQISKILSTDDRIGSKFLKAGIGFGGSCFKKDILNLVYILKYYHLDECTKYWQSVVDINEFQENRFTERILSKMSNTLANRKIAILGYAFKANTRDTRETPAKTVCQNLSYENAILNVYDPMAKIDNFLYDKITQVNSIEEACKDADAIVILTDWKQFKDLNWSKIYQITNKPIKLFDGRNCINKVQLQKIGFKVYSIGE